MTQPPHDEPIVAGSEELREQVEQTREELSQTEEALAVKTDGRRISSASSSAPIVTASPGPDRPP